MKHMLCSVLEKQNKGRPYLLRSKSVSSSFEVLPVKPIHLSCYTVLCMCTMCVFRKRDKYGWRHSQASLRKRSVNQAPLHFLCGVQLLYLSTHAKSTKLALYGCSLQLQKRVTRCQWPSFTSQCLQFVPSSLVKMLFFYLYTLRKFEFCNQS